MTVDNSNPGNPRLIRVFDPVEGSGNAGTLEIASDNIQLNGGFITAISAGGDGGNINLNSNILELRNGGNITTTAGLQNTSGSGGNIDLNSQFIIAFPQGNNDITANAFEGDGGNISIATEGIFGIQERSRNNSSTNDITASSNAGISGDILITTPDINPVQGATELPTNVVVPEETTQQACEVNREVEAKNGLSITGKGGIPAEPGLPIDSLNVTVNGASNSTSTTSTISQPIETAQGKIQPARGVSVTESGEVILTAYPTNNAGDKPEGIAPQRIPEGTANCGRV